MADRSLKVFLKTMFGIGGLVIIFHAWLIPTAPVERVTATTFAVLGWIWAWRLR